MKIHTTAQKIDTFGLGLAVAMKGRLPLFTTSSLAVDTWGGGGVICWIEVLGLERPFV